MNFSWGSFPVFSKDPDWETKYPLLDFRVRFLVEQYALFLRGENAGTLVLTDFDTLGVHSTGCHYEKRAVDVGLRELPLARAEAFAEWVNGFLSYGHKGYVSVVVGKFDPKGKHNDHLHFQAPSPYQVHGHINLRGLLG